MKCPHCSDKMLFTDEVVVKYCHSCCAICGKKFKAGDSKLFHVTGLFIVHENCISKDYSRIWWWDSDSVMNHYHTFHNYGDSWKED